MLKALKKLSQASVFAITAAMGFSSTADQASALTVDEGEGVIILDAKGDNPTKASELLQKQYGFTVSPKELMAANNIKDARKIPLNAELKIPGFLDDVSNEESVIVVSTKGAAEALEEKLTGGTDVKLPASTPVVEKVAADAEVILADATPTDTTPKTVETAPSTPVVQNTINNFDADLERSVLEATENFSLAFPNKTDEQVLYMAMGYREAIKFANENGEDCDEELGDMEPDDIKKFLSLIYSNATPNQINEMAQGFGIGASSAVANDILKDALPYWVAETKREHAGLSDDVINIIAQESLEAYLDGKDCVGAGCEVEETVAVTPEPVLETIPVVKASLCNSINNQPELPGGVEYDFKEVADLNGILGPDFELPNKNPLNVTGLEPKAGQLSKEYIALCTGTGPIVHVPKTSTNDGETQHPGLTSSIRITGNFERCEEVLRADGKISLRGNFQECCFGQRYEITDAHGRLLQLMGSTTTGVCAIRDGGDTPVVTPNPVDPVDPVDPPDDGGGCEAKGNCPKPPVDPVHPVDPKPHPKPDPEICDPANPDGNQPGGDAGAGSGKDKDEHKGQDGEQSSEKHEGNKSEGQEGEQSTSETGEKHTAVYPNWDIKGVKTPSFGIA